MFNPQILDKNKCVCVSSRKIEFAVTHTHNFFRSKPGVYPLYTLHRVGTPYHSHFDVLATGT